MIDPKLIEDVWAWQKDSFKEATYSGAFQHRCQEGWELIEELADFAIITIHWLKLLETPKHKILLEVARLAWATELCCREFDLADAIRKKLAKNKARVWPERPDENGTYQHVKEGTGET